MGLIDQAGGRTRRYCCNAHKMAEFRERKQEEKRNNCLQRNADLQNYWQENGINGEVLTRLETMLVKYGKEAARYATDTILIAVQLSQRGVQGYGR